MADLAEAQLRSGFDVRVLCHQHGDEPLRQAGDGVPVERVRTYGTLCYVPVAPSFRYALQKQIESFRPDVIHVHMPNVAGFLIPSSYTGKVIVHWHSDVIFPDEKFIPRLLYVGYALWERKLLRRADSIIATSPPYLSGSQPLKAFLSKSKIVPLGMNPKRLSRFSDAEIESAYRCYAPAVKNGKLFVSVGRLSHYKGLQYLIEAMQGTNSRLVIIGSGEERDALERLVSDLNLSEQVVFTGYLEDSAMNKILAAADMCCLPSTDRSEAFGLIQLEAMALGVPCLSTAIKGSGTGWVNRNGETGIVVPPESVSALHNVIRKAECGEIDLAVLGEQANQYFRKKYDIIKTVESISSLYLG